MTQSTDSRQLRLLIDGILGVYGIDNLELSIKLCEGVKRINDSPTPARTREEIIADLQRRVVTGQKINDQHEAIADEIHRRTFIRPVTQEWQEFIKFAYREQKDHGKTIGAFLDWWMSDEWQAAHPPARPDIWYVKWDQAFKGSTPCARRMPEVVV